MKKRQKVMLGIPTMSNRITIQLAGILEAMRHSEKDSESEFDFKFLMEMGRSPVEYARNVLVGQFLRTDCEKLWFMDEDMLPTSSVARLLYSDADIIAARMYKFDHPNPDAGTQVGLGLCAMTKASNGLFSPLMPSVGENSVQNCDAVGTGCTVITRRVLEDRRLWFPNIVAEINKPVVDGNVDCGTGDYAPAIFRTQRAPNGKGIMGEDIDFCVRAKALGYSIQVDLNAVCGHFKTIDVDQAGFLAQETVKRVLSGISTADGKVFKLDPNTAFGEKALSYPSLDKSAPSVAAGAEAIQ